MLTRASLTVLVWVAGCSSPQQIPLGGPYGGTAAPTPPGGDEPTQSAANDTDSSLSDSPSSDPSGSPRSVDSGFAIPDASSPSVGSCSTWSCLYESYMKAGAIGNCGRPVCHSQMSSPPGAYDYLRGRGQMGEPPKLTSSGSCLTWYGGNMPIGTQPSAAQAAQAVSDMNAWAAAGALNN